MKGKEKNKAQLGKQLKDSTDYEQAKKNHTFSLWLNLLWPLKWGNWTRVDEKLNGTWWQREECCDSGLMFGFLCCVTISTVSSEVSSPHLWNGQTTLHFTVFALRVWICNKVRMPIFESVLVFFLSFPYVDMVFHEWNSVCDVCITLTTKNTKLKRFNIDRRTCLTYTIYIGVYERCCVWMKLCHHVWNDGEKTTRLVTFFCLSLCEKMFIWWVDEKWCDVHSICHEVIWWLWWWMMNGGEQESQIKTPQKNKNKSQAHLL